MDKRIQWPFRTDRPTLAMGVIVLLFVAIMTVASVTKTSVYDGYGTDLGNMWQSVWNLAHGHGWTFTHPLAGEQVSRLAYHADYTLWLYLPIAWWSEGWMAMLFVQALAVGLSGWALYWLTRRVVGQSVLAMLLASGYLAAGVVQFPVLWQYHAVTLVPLFLLAMAEAVYAGRRSRWPWFWFVLALLSIEHVGFVAGPLLAWLFWRRGQLKLAFMAWLIGWGWSLAQFGIVIPAARPAGAAPHFFVDSYFLNLNGDNGSLLNSIQNPRWVWDRLGKSQYGENIYLLLLPSVGLALASPLAIVGVLVVLPFWLSDLPSAQTLWHHHHVLALPLFALASAGGLAMIRRHLPFVQPHRDFFLGAWLSVGLVMSTYAFSALPWTQQQLTGWWQTDPSLRHWSRDIAKLPKNASVAYSPGFDPHARTFRHSLQLPRISPEVEYVIFFQPRIPVEQWGPRLKPLVERSRQQQAIIEDSAAWNIVLRRSNGAIYRRIRALTAEEYQALATATAP